MYRFTMAFYGFVPQGGDRVHNIRLLSYIPEVPAVLKHHFCCLVYILVKINNKCIFVNYIPYFSIRKSSKITKHVNISPPYFVMLSFGVGG